MSARESNSPSARLARLSSSRDNSTDRSIPSIAGYVALTRASLRIPDVYEILPDRPYAFGRQRDVESRYRTCSMLALPIQDARGGVFGVLQLINALNDAGKIVAFDSSSEDIAAALLTRLARSMLPAGSP